MDISTRFKPGPGPATALGNEAASALKGERASSATVPQVEPVAAVHLHLDSLREVLRDLPEVDLNKVQAIKAALARGEIASDPQTLARALLARQRGSDG
jgi:negative regulator of flagellin synthesis FlgM